MTACLKQAETRERLIIVKKLDLTVSSTSLGRPEGIKYQGSYVREKVVRTEEHDFNSDIKPTTNSHSC